MTTYSTPRRTDMSTRHRVRPCRRTMTKAGRKRRNNSPGPTAPGLRSHHSQLWRSAYQPCLESAHQKAFPLVRGKKVVLATHSVDSFIRAPSTLYNNLFLSWFLNLHSVDIWGPTSLCHGGGVLLRVVGGTGLHPLHCCQYHQWPSHDNQKCPQTYVPGGHIQPLLRSPGLHACVSLGPPAPAECVSSHPYLRAQGLPRACNTADTTQVFSE